MEANHLDTYLYNLSYEKKEFERMLSLYPENQSEIEHYYNETLELINIAKSRRNAFDKILKNTS